MKIAVPLTNEEKINGHFGNSDSYGVFTIAEGNEITDVQIVASPEGCGCKSDIAQTLAGDGVTVLLAGGIGGGAVNKFTSQGISVIRGCSGNAREAVRLYLAGEIEDTGSNCHKHGTSAVHLHHDHHHHHHVHGHNCSHN
jgi:predicted Fe-Mo cluster-binding NifX family protein